MERYMKTHFIRLVTLTLLCGRFVAAQPVDDTRLKQVIIFGRHGVRTPVVPNSTLNHFSVLPFPTFNVAGVANPGPSVLTTNGRTNEIILGGYFRLWLTQEGLLTGNDSADAAFVYVRATGTPLISDTARAFAAGLLPAATLNVNSYAAPAADPLFDPVDAGVAVFSGRKAVAAVNGRLGGNAQSLTLAYASELALARSILLNYPAGTTPAPAVPPNVVDVAALPIEITAGTAATPINLGGLADVIYAIDPFVMEYADGLPASEVGWGQLTADSISQTFRLYNVALDLEYKTPYMARVLSSNMASHVARTMVQAATGNAMTGTLGSPSSKVIVVTAANTNMTGFAGLLHLDWLQPGYQNDVLAPGGAITFELRQSQSTGEYVVRTSYIAQTMDQLRNLTPLTLSAPPASAPVLVPGCTIRNAATLDCPLGVFVTVVDRALDPHSVDLIN
jgi:4-phytase/acid phosphatase